MGVDVKFSLFYVAWESWHIIHLHDQEGFGFQFRSPGKFSYNQSKHYGLVYWNYILPGFPGILHLPSCMDRPWI